MPVADIFYLLQWWFILFAFGAFFFPFATRLFPSFLDKGYVFAKVIGIVIISYCIFVLGVLHLVPFTQTTALVLALFIGTLFFITNRFFLSSFGTHWKILCVEESIFLLTLLFWSYIRIHQPDIYGLEKYMDFGFVNSILRSTFFPPKDMWFTPFSINYYYFGHLITAVITKISGIPSSVTYNLMIATLFAFSFTLSFSLIFTIASAIHIEKMKKTASIKQRLFTFFASLFTAALLSMGGNLHILYIFFTQYQIDTPKPFWQLSLAMQSIPNNYWYPNATRFIHNTIHEFPIYSFVVSDLHGHVLDIPLILTIIALLYELFFSKKIKIIRLLFLSFFLSCAYMTNAWDGGIYLLLTFLVITYTQLVPLLPKIQNNRLADFLGLLFYPPFLLNLFYYCLLVLAGFFLFSLPFSLFFQTGAIVHGVGVLCAPEFLTRLQHIGPFLFEADHCQRSPLWQLAILYGFFYFFVLSLILFFARTKKIQSIDIFILLLIGMATILIGIPEFFYMKDIYPAHYRANTMFKLTYEAFMLLSLVSGYVVVRILSSIPRLKTVIGRIGTFLFLLATIVLGILLLSYPSSAINSYYENLRHPKSLDGTLYLKNLHPDDYKAIQWIQKNIQGQPIVLEAQGDSYTDYARISANTGLPTILGWTVHEWLWRGSYDIPSPRITDVQTLYETTNLQQAKNILKKYRVSYVYVGDLERTKYPKLSEKKFQSLGRIIFQQGNTRMYATF